MVPPCYKRTKSFQRAMALPDQKLTRRGFSHAGYNRLGTDSTRSIIVGDDTSDAKIANTKNMQITIQPRKLLVPQFLAFALLDLQTEYASATILPTMVRASSALVSPPPPFLIHHRLISNASTRSPPPPPPRPLHLNHRHTQLRSPGASSRLHPHSRRLQRPPRFHRSHRPCATQHAFHLESAPA